MNIVAVPMSTAVWIADDVKGAAATSLLPVNLLIFAAI